MFVYNSKGNVIEGIITSEIKDDLIIIPEGVEKINPRIFNGLKKIKYVTFPSTLKEIGEDAFVDCTNLKTIDLIKTNNVTIKKEAFCGCNNLKEIIFPENINSIGEYAFASCESLEEVKINNVNTIETAPFVGNNLRKIIISKNNPIYSDMDCNIIYNKETDTIIQGCNTSIIPENTKVIGVESFRYACLEKIILPKSVEKVLINAFEDCTFNELILNEELKEIGPFAFSGDSPITKLEIPASVEYIGEGAFCFLPQLKEVVIKGSSSINKNVFSECDNLKNIFICSPDCSFMTNITYNPKVNIYMPLCENYARLSKYLGSRLKILTLDNILKIGISFNKANKIFKNQNENER